MHLWLVRHALPLIAPGLCYGRHDILADAPATRLAAAALATELPHGLPVACSPLQRCQQLGQALLALRPDLRLHTDAALAEMDFGTWEGQPWSTIGKAAIDAWTRDFAQARPGGGESAQQVLERVGGRLEAARASGTDLAWLTHAGPIRAARLWAGGTRQLHHASDWPAQAPGYGGWERLEL
ncbi:MAG TPA: histidine phosphatase family protein [Burkholderiaceae bacterium]